MLGLAVGAEQALEHEQEEDPVRVLAPAEARTDWVPSTVGIESAD